MRTQYKAYCYANGDIYFGLVAPKGSIVIASGPYRMLKEAVETVARHGYKKGELLVPGVPEAPTAEEAIEAVVRFVRWVGGLGENTMWRSPEDIQSELVRLTGISAPEMDQENAI